MKTINWNTASDLEKNAAVAEEVARQVPVEVLVASRDEGKSAAYIQDRETSRSDVQDFCRRHPEYKEVYWKTYPDYLRNPGQCLRLLQEQYSWHAFKATTGHAEEFVIGVAVEIATELWWKVNRTNLANWEFTGIGKDFCEAACIALLRAAGMEVIT